MRLNLKRTERRIGNRSGTVDAFAVEDHKCATIRRRICCWRCNNLFARNLHSRQGAADPTEIVAIEQIGLAVLAEREHQMHGSRRIAHIYREWTGATEVGVAAVEQGPVG